MNYLPLVFDKIEEFYKNNRALLLENDKYRPCKSLTRDIIATIDKFKEFYVSNRSVSITLNQIIHDICGFSSIQDVVNTNIRVMKELKLITQNDNDYLFTRKFTSFVNSNIGTKKYLYELLLNCNSFDDFNMLFNGIICALREGYINGCIISFPDSNEEFHSIVNDKAKRISYCRMIYDIYGFHGRNKEVDSDEYTPNPNYRIFTVLKLLELISPGQQVDGMNTFVLTAKGIELLKHFNRNVTYFNVNKKEIDENTRIKSGTNIILYGVPGAGKSWTIKHEYCDDEERMERLVFHPDYTYSDFVGQILPHINEDGSVSYEFTPGPFTNLVKKAYENPLKEFYLVIEEVNRGNAPAIFGDVFQLLDRNKDCSSEYEITNNDIAKVVYGNENHKVTIPSNMHILCTMNTSDQNVFTLDTAFQRRWSMRLIKNKFREEASEKTFADTKILDTSVSWNKFFSEINKIILSKNIRMTSSEDKRLGTHFVNEEDLVFVDGDEKQNSRFPEKVLKYLWDDAFKFTKEDIFDLTKVKSLEDVIDIFTTSKKDERFKVFKENIYKTFLKQDTNE